MGNIGFRVQCICQSYIEGIMEKPGNNYGILGLLVSLVLFVFSLEMQ